MKNNVVNNLIWTNQNYLTITDKNVRSFFEENYDNLTSPQMTLQKKVGGHFESRDTKKFVIDGLTLVNSRIRNVYRHLLTIVDQCIKDPSDKVFLDLLNHFGMSFDLTNELLNHKNGNLDPMVPFEVIRIHLVEHMESILEKSGSPSSDEEHFEVERVMLMTLVKVKNSILSHYSPLTSENDNFYKYICNVIVDPRLQETFGNIGRLVQESLNCHPEFNWKMDEGEGFPYVRQSIHDVLLNLEDNVESIPVVDYVSGMMFFTHYSDDISQNYNEITDEYDHKDLGCLFKENPDIITQMDTIRYRANLERQENDRVLNLMISDMNSCSEDELLNKWGVKKVSHV